MEIRLGSIISLITDYHANGSYEILKEKVELLDEPDYALMVRTTNFETNDFKNKNKYISETAYRFLKKSRVYAGDILMNKIANAGSVYLMPNLKRPVSLAMNLFLIRIDPKKANSVFIFHLMKLYEPYIKQFAQGTATKTITKAAVRNLKFKLPKLPFQNKIASILSTYDELIENNNQRITLLEQMAEEIYKEWFVRLRFPGYENTPLVDGLPDGWEMNTLEKYLIYYRGKSYSSEELSEEEGLPLLNLKCVNRGGGFRRDGLKYFNGKYSYKNVAYAGDVIMAITDMTQNRDIVGRVALVPEMDIDKFIFSMDLIRLKPINISKTFLYSLFRFSGIGLDLKEFANGANVLHLTPSVLNSQIVTMPPENLRMKFDKIVNPIFKEIDILEVKNENLKQTRDLLLPRLISGKLSVEHLVKQEEHQLQLAL